MASASKGGPLPALGGRAKLLTHVGHGLLRHGLRRRAGRAELHGGGRPDRPAVGHDDSLGGEADQGPGRDGALVHELHRPDAAPEQGVTDQDCRVHTSPERVDLQDHGGGPGRGRLVQDTPDEGGQPKVDHPLDRRHVHDRAGRRRHVGGPEREHGQEPPDERARVRRMVSAPPLAGCRDCVHDRLIPLRRSSVSLDSKSRSFRLGPSVYGSYREWVRRVLGIGSPSVYSRARRRRQEVVVIRQAHLRRSTPTTSGHGHPSPSTSPKP
jgi:hypothetical protein